MMSIHRLVVSALLVGFASATARAQSADSTLAPATERSLIGTTRVFLDATYFRVEHYSSFVATAGAAPFVTDHVQLGLTPSTQIYSSPGGRSHTETVALLANYLFRDGSRSRPYVGAYLLEGGESAEHGYGVFGLQAGWLHFLAPATALRAEFRFRRYSAASYETDELLVAIDPYLFGRANERLTTPPGFGTFDATFVGDLEVHPDRQLRVTGSVAPFFTRWLQGGVVANYSSSFEPQSSAHNLELYGRGYLPIQTRIVPFGDAFFTTTTVGGGEPTIDSHGARVGVRSYLTQGVALDLAYEWRNFEPYGLPGAPASIRPGEQRSLGAALVMQFRSKRSRS